jgi:hypothetical protein
VDLDGAEQANAHAPGLACPTASYPSASIKD